MTEPKSPEAGGGARPAAGPGEPRAAVRCPPAGPIQRNFERALGLAQLTVALPVVVLLLSGIGAFVYATVYAVHDAINIAGHPFVAHNLRLFLTEIDLFLIGVTLIIAAFGLYELFISRIGLAGTGRPLPAWLDMRDLNDLKARVISMIILVIAVSFADQLLEFGQGLDILYLGAGVAVVIGGLTVYLRFGTDTSHEPDIRG